MKKIKYVSFQESGAKVYINQDPPAGYPFLINPDTSLVDDLPLHMWVLERGKILPGFPKGNRFQYKKPMNRLLVLGLSVLGSATVSAAVTWLCLR